ncbi:MAG: nucleoside 2-deoxyribosyltransferase domain-containing protein [Polyangiaceae bacterium]|nr:nucleoside 2-deoxyribosyltransferase domain-containing protein [Polyangiaceae bacterium]
MLELKPPTPFSEAPRPWFFLAGSIEMDRAERWQERLVAQLAKRDGSILNPRRDSWDASWRQDLSEPRFVEQVEWELAGQEQADRR